MQVKQFLPHIKYKLVYINLIIYGLTFFIFFQYRTDVIWGYETLSSFIFNNKLPSTAEAELTQRAMDYAKKGNPQKCQELLKKAIKIDPYSQAQLLLGASYEGQGRVEQALKAYIAYLDQNPSNFQVYYQIINILEKKEDTESLKAVVSKGIDYFRERIKLYKPQLDPEVEDRYNEKAESIYNDSIQNLNLLKYKKNQIETVKYEK